MATMDPESLNDEFVPDSEKRVFEKLKKLHHDIYVVWSVTCTKVQDREVDFVIIDPYRRSILVLEVKGGGISLEGGQWYSTARSGQKHKIADPVEQARRGSYEIKNTIVKKYPELETTTMSWGWGVVFPDALCPPEMMTEESPVIPRERVIDQEDLDNPICAIDRVFKVFDRGVKLLCADKRFARDTFDAIRPTREFTYSISSYMRENEKTWIQLEPAQLQALSTLKANKRVLIYGAAGTGKTVIATKAAYDAAKNDIKVLYLCFNAPLRTAIYSRVKCENEGYDVYTYNGLCTKIVGHPNPDADTVLRALKKCRSRNVDDFYWDVVIVDEGQDFKTDSWPVIEKLVSVRDDGGSLYVFYDPYQAIAGELDGSIIPIVQKKKISLRFRLTVITEIPLR